MAVEHGMGIENVQVGVALFLMLVNVLILWLGAMACRWPGVVAYDCIADVPTGYARH